MAELATFACPNLQCLLTFRVAHNFPVWDAAHASIVRYRSETFCAACNRVVEYEDGACAACSGTAVADNLGRPCPRCAKGSLSMPHLSAVEF
jgi:hypothetical protein